MSDISYCGDADRRETLSIPAGVELFLRTCSLNPRTRPLYQARLDSFVRFMAEHHADVLSVRELDEKHVTGFMLAMMRSGKAISSVGHLPSTIERWLNFLGERGYVSKNVATTIRRPKQPKHLPFLPPKDKMDLIFEIRDSGGWPERDVAIREMLRYCSAQELISLDVGDVDLREQTICFRHRPECLRLRPMEEYLTGLLVEYLERRAARLEDRKTRNPDSILPLLLNWDLRGWDGPEQARLTQQSVKVIIQRLGTAAGIKNLTPKMVRSATAVSMFESEAGINVVQELLGYPSFGGLMQLRKLALSRLEEELIRTHPSYTRDGS